MTITDVTANKNCHCTGITTITNKPLGHFIPQLLSWPIFLHLNGCGIIWLCFSPLGLVPFSFPVNTKMPLQVRIASGPFLPLKKVSSLSVGKEQSWATHFNKNNKKNKEHTTREFDGFFVSYLIFLISIKLKVKENNSMFGPCTLWMINFPLKWAKNLGASCCWNEKKRNPQLTKNTCMWLWLPLLAIYFFNFCRQ